MIGAVVPAGGSGTRMGGVFKPLLELAGKTVLEHALSPLLERADLTRIVVALPPAVLEAPPAWLRDPRISLTAGGATRMESVRAALDALTSEVQLVVVHDAARPLLSPRLLDRVISALHGGAGGAIAALPASDTVHLVSGDILQSTPDRAGVWLAQTPQAFPRELLLQAHDAAGLASIDGTDDAALVARLGYPVRVVHGDPLNLKITSSADLALAEYIYRNLR